MEPTRETRECRISAACGRMSDKYNAYADHNFKRKQVNVLHDDVRRIRECVFWKSILASKAGIRTIESSGSYAPDYVTSWYDLK